MQKHNKKYPAVLNRMQMICERFPSALIGLRGATGSPNVSVNSAMGDLAASARRYAAGILSYCEPEAGTIPLLSDGTEENLAAAVLGIWLAGKCVLPINSREPIERVRRMLGAIEARTVFQLSECKSPSRLREELGSQIEVLLPGKDSLEKLAAFKADDRIFSIFTSGSTGTPKLIHVRWRNLRAWLLNSCEVFPPLVPGSRFLNLWGWGFDAWFEPLLWGLSSGALVQSTAPLDLLRNGERWRCFQPQVISLTPTQGRFVLSLPYISHWRSSLQRTLFGGEILDYGFARDWLKAFPQSVIENTYGPAETTCTVFHHKLCERELFENGAGPVPIGLPHSNVNAKIDNESVLWVATEQVTNECREGGGEWYRTNDLAKWNSDGTATVSGRIDNQIKLNGRRLNLEEVEAAFLSLGIRLWVLKVPHENFLIGVLSTALPYRQLQSANVAVCDRLFSEAIPRKYFVCEAIYLGRTGKIDRAKVLELVQAGLLPEVNFGTEL